MKRTVSVEFQQPLNLSTSGNQVKLQYFTQCLSILLAKLILNSDEIYSLGLKSNFFLKNSERSNNRKLAVKMKLYGLLGEIFERLFSELLKEEVSKKILVDGFEHPSFFIFSFFFLSVFCLFVCLFCFVLFFCFSKRRKPLSCKSDVKIEFKVFK